MISISNSEPSAIQKFLSSHTQVRICNLTEMAFGDYSWLANGISETIERKYITDLISSLYSGRLVEQLRGCLDEYQKVYLLIEGVWDLHGEDRIMVYRRTSRGYLPSTYSPAISFTQVQLLLKSLLQFIDIIPSANQETTAQIVLAMSKSVKPETLMSKVVRKQKRMPRWTRDVRVIKLVNLVDRLSEASAKKLIQQFGSIGKVLNANEEELKQISGMGKQLAKNIKELT